MRRAAASILLLLTALLSPGVLIAETEDSSAAIRIRYLSATAVYLDTGSGAGLAVGDVLEVVRDSAVIGEIQVDFVATHSASCSALRSDVPFAVGDLVRPLAGDGGSAAPASSEPAAATPSADEPPSGPPAETPATVPPRRPPERRRRQRVSGALTFDWESYADSGSDGLDLQRLSSRLSLRVRDIGGSPWQLRVRLRRHEITRDFGGGASETETRDRLYEASLTRDLPESRWGLQVGRIGASPFVGIGYLDGVVGRFGITRTLDIGAFVGTRPDLEELGFQSDGLKYGLFTRLSSSAAPGGPFEVILAGVREEGEREISREYVTLQTRYRAGGRWSFYQRAEVDLNNGWRGELSDQQTQLSNFSLSSQLQIAPTSRLVVTYDRYERYRTEETRFIPEEQFDDLLRQGLRASLWFGHRDHTNFTLSAGLRSRQGDPEDVVTYGVGVRHPNLVGTKVALSADAQVFSNPNTDGYLAIVRARRPLGRGHQVGFTAGTRVSSSREFDGLDTTVSWGRLEAWVELPMNLFANFEVEATIGDEGEGRRLLVQVGRRF